MPASASAVGLGDAPIVLAASQLSTSTFRVLFSGAMSAAGLTTTGNYTLAAQGGSTVRSVSSVVIETPVSVVVTASGTLSAGTNAYQITVTGVSDTAGNPINVAANTAFLTIAGTANSVVSRDGGMQLNASLPPITLGGRYKAYVGPLGNANDVQASSGILGEMLQFRLVPNQPSVPVVVPNQTIGPGLLITFVAQDTTASPPTFQSPTVVQALPRQFYSGVISLRKLFPSRYDVGPINPAEEVAQ